MGPLGVSQYVAAFNHNFFRINELRQHVSYARMNGAKIIIIIMVRIETAVLSVCAFSKPPQWINWNVGERTLNADEKLEREKYVKCVQIIQALHTSSSSSSWLCCWLSIVLVRPIPPMCGFNVRNIIAHVRHTKWLSSAQLFDFEIVQLLCIINMALGTATANTQSNRN